MGSMTYIRRMYRVLAYRGGRVSYLFGDGIRRFGRITGSRCGLLRVLVGNTHRMLVHPKDTRLVYEDHVK